MFETIVQFFACRTADGKFEWDRAERMNDALMPQVDRWGGRQLDPDAGREESRVIWELFPPEDRGIVRVRDILLFEHVADIDATGDDYFRGPHVYVDRPFHPLQGPFTRQEVYYEFSVHRDNEADLTFDEAVRSPIFPRL